MNKEMFINECKKLGVMITDDIMVSLETYATYLIDYNMHTNLTTITNIEDIYLKHFYDSITIVKSINLNDNLSLIDVGSGAGFPGVVLKIIYPSLNVTLLDSNNKKTKFLKEIIELLKLENIEVIEARSEEYAKQHIDEYDLVTSRAVANLYTLSELCLPLVKVGGYFIPLKGNIESELEEAKTHIVELKGNIEEIIEFTLPKENSIRNIIKIKKIDKNPAKYPRKYAIIKKSHENNK